MKELPDIQRPEILSSPVDEGVRQQIELARRR
jgi:hypothetical protein